MRFCLRRTGTKYVPGISLLVLVLKYHIWCCAFDSYRKVSVHESIKANDQHTRSHTIQEFRSTCIDILPYKQVQTNEMKKQKGGMTYRCC